MLLNKIGVLDKGFVALVSSNIDGQRLGQLKDELFRSNFIPDLIRISNLVVLVKCPLFVQLNLSKFGFEIINVPVYDEKLEAYNPDLTDIGGKVREDNIAIADDLQRTTEALLINPKAYQHDGCNRFISQVITPISTYTQLIVHGNLEQWIRFISQENLPNPIYAYRTAVEDIMKAEWKNLNEIINQTSNRYR